MNPNYNNQPYQNANFGMNYGMYPVQQKGITTVAVLSGDDAVQSYPVAAGNTAVLMDFTNMKFWLKTTDIYGRPLPPEAYQFAPIQNTQPPQPSPTNQNDYVKKEDFNVVVQMVSELYKELKGEPTNVQSQ